jgi:hypothetical protein
MSEHFYLEEDAKTFFMQYGRTPGTRRSPLSDAAIREAISHLLSIMELPDFLSAFPASVYNQHVLDHLSIALWNTSTTKLRMYLKEQNVDPVDFRVMMGEKNFKARLLGAEGRYPNVEIHDGTSIYAFRAGLPIILTNDDDSMKDSEVGFLNAAELKLSAAIMLEPEHRGLSIHFDDENILRISTNALIGLSPQNMVDLSFELLLLKSRRQKHGSSAIDRKTYEFAEFNQKSKSLTEILKSIDTSDELQMRTLFYLVKSRMLWTNRCFGEDAIANVMFCLEGALLLLQRRNALQDDKIDTKALSEIFKSTFRRGEELFEFVSEGYDKRISIVHPSPSDGPKWMPFLLADDFYEYYDIARMLLIYLACGMLIELR